MDRVTSKVINIKSELLCRSAEDDFFYFNKILSAYKKLKEAVMLTPYHLKSVILLADVAFIKGNIKKALELYLRAEKINKVNVKVLASIANCFFVSEDYSKALMYCNKAISNFNTQNYALFSQVFEMKINILTAQKDYAQAYKTWQNAEKMFGGSFLNVNYKILNEKINLQKKLQKSNLKIV